MTRARSYHPLGWGRRYAFVRCNRPQPDRPGSRRPGVRPVCRVCQSTERADTQTQDTHTRDTVDTSRHTVCVCVCRALAGAHHMKTEMKLNERHMLSIKNVALPTSPYSQPPLASGPQGQAVWERDETLWTLVSARAPARALWPLRARSGARGRFARPHPAAWTLLAQDFHRKKKEVGSE